MEKIEKGHPLSQSADIVKENIETLKRLFPTIVKEDKIDFNELKALINEEIEDNEEYYRFTWAGKSEARREANKQSTATLRPNKADSKNWDTTQNIFIEGDNLEVLKLLQKSYPNQIKMMYFDPPYNTGKDFVYKDNYADNLGNYLSLTGQTDAEGRKISTNTESDGRYHSNWLNMMYPRLKLARNLLSDDGVIFISIDENEIVNLKKICDEIFGEENFISILSVENNPKGRKNSKFISGCNEFCIIYSKNKDLSYFIENIPKSSSDMTEDEDGNFVHNSGKRVLVGENKFNNKVNDTNSEKHYSVYYNKTTNEIQIIKETNINEINYTLTNFGFLRYYSYFNDYFVENTYTKSKFLELFNKRALEFKQDKIFEKNFNSVIRMKSILSNKEYEALINNKVMNYKLDVKTTSAGTLLKELFNSNESIFTAPKNIGLIKLFCTLFEDNDFYILDIFAGSGTTAHAVMQLNAEDNGNRKTISVQLPETTDESSEAYNAGYKNIAEITKERIRRAGDKIIADKKAELECLKKSMEGKMFQEEIQQKMEQIQTTIDHLDIGFKAFKLDSSNIKTWDGNLDQLQNNLFNSQDNIKEDRTEEDLLFEILLKYGLDLTVHIEQKIVENCTIYNIGSGVLFVCISDKITTEVATSIGKWKEELQPTTCRVLFKDNGFKDDVAKTNSIQILRQFGIEECNSI